MRLIDEIMNEVKDVMDKFDEPQLEKAMDLLKRIHRSSWMEKEEAGSRHGDLPCV